MYVKTQQKTSYALVKDEVFLLVISYHNKQAKNPTVGSISFFFFFNQEFECKGKERKGKTIHRLVLVWMDKLQYLKTTAFGRESLMEIKEELESQSSKHTIVHKYPSFQLSIFNFSPGNQISHLYFLMIVWGFNSAFTSFLFHIEATDWAV